MPSVFESVTGLLAQGDTMSKLGGALGTNAGSTQRAVEAATPALLGGMADRAEQPGGLAAITNMLDVADRSPQSGVAGLLGGGDSKLGIGMLDGLFGSDRSDLLSGLATKAGVSSGLMGKLLPMLAPVVMGVLAKRRATDGLNEVGIGQLLTGERDNMRRSGLLGAGAVGAGAVGASALGSRTERTAERGATALRERPNVDLPNRPSGGGFGWLKWLLGAIVVIALAAWALSQCGGADDLTGTVGDVTDEVTDAAGDVADAAEDVVDDAAETVDDAADTAGDAVEEAADAVTGVDLQPDVDGALAGVGAAGLAGTIEDGVVTLTGEADSEEAKAAAEAAVAGIDGVTSVDNQITVAAPEAEEEESSAPAAGSTINDLLDLDPITFAVNSAEITAEGKSVLASAVEFMTANPDVNVEIGGHTDSDGDDAFNLALSQDRADSVKAFLESEGVDGARMTTKGYGEADPKVDNDTDENKAINRRIEFTIQ